MRDERRVNRGRSDQHRRWTVRRSRSRRRNRNRGTKSERRHLFWEPKGGAPGAGRSHRRQTSAEIADQDDVAGKRAARHRQLFPVSRPVETEDEPRGKVRDPLRTAAGERLPPNVGCALASEQVVNALTIGGPVGWARAGNEGEFVKSGAAGGGDHDSNQGGRGRVTKAQIRDQLPVRRDKRASREVIARQLRRRTALDGEPVNRPVRSIG